MILIIISFYFIKKKKLQSIEELRKSWKKKNVDRFLIDLFLSSWFIFNFEYVTTHLLFQEVLFRTSEKSSVSRKVINSFFESDLCCNLFVLFTILIKRSLRIDYAVAFFDLIVTTTFNYEIEYHIYLWSWIIFHRFENIMTNRTLYKESRCFLTLSTIILFVLTSYFIKSFYWVVSSSS